MRGFVKNKKLIIFLIILGVFNIGSVVFALQVAWPPSPLGTSLNDDSELPTFIGYLYEWGISIGGFLVFIALIIAGFQYLGSIGNPAMMRGAKDRIISALLGLALLLGSWLILNTINPQLTKLQLPPFDPGEYLKIEKIKPPSADEIISKLKPCEKAEIELPGGNTITLDKNVKCSSQYTAEFTISTHDSFNIRGYFEGEATTCAGYVHLYSGTGCETPAAVYNLADVHENCTVGETIQSAEFLKPTK